MIDRELPLILIMHRWRMLSSMARSRSMMHIVQRRLHHWILPEPSLAHLWVSHSMAMSSERRQPRQRHWLRPLPHAWPVHLRHHWSRMLLLLELSVCLPVRRDRLRKLVMHLSVRVHLLLKLRIHLTGTGTRQRHPVSRSMYLRVHPLLTHRTHMTHHPSRHIHVSLPRVEQLIPRPPTQRMTHRAIPRYRIPHPIELRYLAPVRRYLDNTVNPRRCHRRRQQSPLSRDVARKFTVQPRNRSQSFSTHWPRRDMVVFVILEMDVTLSNRSYQLHMRIYIERGGYPIYMGLMYSWQYVVSARVLKRSKAAVLR